MQATAHQAERMDQLDMLLKKGVKRINLVGSAGVGKTFCVRDLVIRKVNNLARRTGRWAVESVFITAPTNKALSILQSKIPRDSSVVFSTTHSALKMVRDINPKTGNVSFRPAYSEKNRPFEGCVMAVVDEASMLESKILDMLDDFNFPIIFVGDDKQINPIGEPFSPVFHRGYPTIELTEIIRQGEGNPIIELSRNLDLIGKRQPNVNAEGYGYIFQNSMDAIIQNLAAVNGTDELKYMAWSNAEVDGMNDKVRRVLYGRNPNKIELGETLVLNAPKGEHWTNKEIRVEDLKLVTENIRIPTAYSKYGVGGVSNTDSIKMRVYRINDDFSVVHEQSQNMFNTILSHIKVNCAKFGWNWKGKYFFEEQFADTKYNHAITVHKSQGSTYREAVVNVGNIKFNKNLAEQKRLLYTGVTRPEKLLILYNA